MYEINEYLVQCNICNKEIKFGDLGLTALLRHAKQKKHQKNLQRRQVNPSKSVNVSSSSNSNTSTSGQLTDDRYENNATLTEKIAHAETLWSAIVAEDDLSFLVSDHVSKISNKIFPDSAVAAGFKCYRTKANCIIIDRIYVDIQEKLIKTLHNIPFSLLIEESNKQYEKKFLSVMIKFYEENYNGITVRFLDLCVCNNGTSDELKKTCGYY